jgi:tetratricopeptide (TPR) repeat protein
MPRTALPTLRPASGPPKAALAPYHRATAAHNAGRYDEAIPLFKDAIRKAPAFLQAQTGLGAALLLSHRYADAIPVLEKAVALAPTTGDVTLLLAHAFWETEQYALAAKWYARTAELNPTKAEPLAFLGGALRQLGQLREALVPLNKALQLDPKHALSLFNTGISFHDLGDLSMALTCFDQTLEIDPTHHSARWNRAIALLLLGDYARGWEAHEFRFAEQQRLKKLRPIPGTRWQGEPLPAGARLLIQQEQGLGDQIQFIRYARALKARGLTVIAECDRPVARLIATCPWVDEVVVRGDPVPAYDAWIPFLSLPLALGTANDLMADALPAVSAPGECPPALRDIAAAPGLRVGIVWGGEPNHKNDRNRSIGLAPLLPLLNIPGLSVFSLQKGPREIELDVLAEHDAALRGRITALGPAFSDMGDTAHAVRQLDLVITVDTAVAHLAGTLGVPTWVLVPFTPDWRWQLTRRDSPWYPSVRLFRQPAPQDWTSVVRELVGALLTMTKRR